jgi:tetratricopeptide (TPR) repeat protein
VSGRLANVRSLQDRCEEALPMAEEAFSALEAYERGEDFALLASQIAGMHLFTGERERAREKAELAIECGEALGSPDVLSRAFAILAIVLDSRPEQSIALLKQSLAIAREHDLHEREFNALFNLSDFSFARDRYEDALTYLSDGLELARRRGSRPFEWSALAETTYPLYMLGRWDDALRAFGEIPEGRLRDGNTGSVMSSVLAIHLHRGDVAAASSLLALFEDAEASPDLQDRTMYLGALAGIHRFEGRHHDAITLGVEASRLARTSASEAAQAIKQGLVEAIEAALELGDTTRAEELVASIEAVPPGLRSRYLDAQALRFRGLLATASDDKLERLEAAAKRFRELGIVFWLAVTQLEQAECLSTTGQAGEADSTLEEAQGIFDELRATPWIERARTVGAGRQVAPTHA